MNLLSPLRAITLVFALAGFFPGGAAGQATQIHAARMAESAKVTSIFLATWAGPAKAAGDTDQDNSTPKQPTPAPPSSYVGAVVGTMFIAGMILMMLKLQRRKPRRNIYRYGRSGYHRSGGRSRVHRRAA